jgi:hypothetical protein
MRGRSIAAAAAALMITGGPATANAVDWEVTGDVAAQGYEIVSPWGDRILGRRRLASTVGLATYNLQGGGYQPFKPNYSVQLRMRVDADFGINGAEHSYDPGDRTRFVPGLAYSPVDLMYAFVEGRNLAGGVLDFKVGRQYTTNVFGWWSFDGGLIHVKTPFFFALEAYGGLEQRGGMPLSIWRFESQGVWRGGHGSQLRDDAHLYPSFQFAQVAPAFGVAAETSGPNWIKARVDYRRVYNLGEAFTGQFPFPDSADKVNKGGFEKINGLRISSDKIGIAASVFIPGTVSVNPSDHILKEPTGPGPTTIVGLRGGAVYDLYFGHLTRAYGSVDIHAGKRVTIGLDGEYFWPSFDADSIFNWFTHNPSASAVARVAAKPIDKLQLSASGGAKLWLTEGNPETWAAEHCAATNPQATAQQIEDCKTYGLDSSNIGATSKTSFTFTRDEQNRKSKISPDLLANLGAGYAWLTGNADLRAMLQTGFGGEATNRGRRAGGTISAVQALKPGIVWLGGRVSTYNWHDPLRPDRGATSFGYVIAPEVQPVKFGKIRVEWEHEMNRLVGQRFRLLGLITMRVAP